MKLQVIFINSNLKVGKFFQSTIERGKTTNGTVMRIFLSIRILRDLAKCVILL